MRCLRSYEQYRSIVPADILSCYYYDYYYHYYHYYYHHITTYYCCTRVGSPHFAMTKADTRTHLAGSFTSLGHAPFVQPSSYLRPPMTSAERPVDREERQGLVSLLSFPAAAAGPCLSLSWILTAPHSPSPSPCSGGPFDSSLPASRRDLAGHAGAARDRGIAIVPSFVAGDSSHPDLD